MKKIFVFILLLLNIADVHSQNNDTINQSKIDSIIKYQFIYLYVSDRISNLSTTEMSTLKTSTSSSRIIKINFSVGLDGTIEYIGRKGTELEVRIKSDPEALAEFKKAREHRRKSKACFRYELLGYFVAVAACVPGVIGLIKKDDNEKEDAIPFLVGGGIGIVGGFVVINVFHFKTDKELDSYITYINSTVAIYNQNLLLKK